MSTPTPPPAPKPAPSPGARPQAAPAANFGRIDDDGAVFLRLPDGSERQVGQWATGNPAQAMEFFTNKYADLITEIDLAAKRLADDRATPAQAQATIGRIRSALAEPAFVGDLAALVARVGQLEVLINVKKAALAETKAADRAQSMATRTALVEEAETLSTSEQWRVTTERFKSIIDEWKLIPRSDRGSENELWKRLSAARTTFDKRRRIHYAELESARDSAKDAKLELVREAEKLSTSTDWAKTTRSYRELLEKWKKAGRAGKSDDRLWGQFRAAQDAFFKARNATYAGRDEDEKKALAAKEELLAEADKLLPVKDPRAAKRALRAIHDKWDKAGRVPRGDMKRIEARLSKVEEAIRGADSPRGHSANPELRGRAADTVSGFRSSVEKLEKKLAAAKAAGDEAAVTKAQSALDSAQMLLAAAESGLAKFGG
ncbi:MAG: DUF349 domain-containing protein [Candidatus Nanopelagicales bacterium]